VVIAVTNGRLDGSTERSPRSLAPWSEAFETRRNGWPGSLDGRRCKRVLIKIVSEQGCSELS
jgi:hypothetical protein